MPYTTDPGIIFAKGTTPTNDLGASICKAIEAAGRWTTEQDDDEIPPF